MISIDEIARLDEGRIATSLPDIASETRLIPAELGGGIMCRGVPGTWINVAMGIGLAGPVSSSVVDEIVDWHASHGAEPRVEVTPSTHESLLAALAERRFVLRLFEHVFFIELFDGFVAASPYPTPPGITIAELDITRRDVVRACAKVVASGFAVNGEPSEADLDLWSTSAAHPRVKTVVAFDGSEVVGAGSFEVFNQAAGLFGLSVAPGYRRRGVQLALIAARLQNAASRGVKLVTVAARPGVATERNARRMGFQMAYTKAILVRPGPGLAPVVG